MAKTNKKYQKSAFEDPSVTEVEPKVEMPKAVADSIAKPDTEVDKANDYINNEYPWCVGSLTSPQRAMLCELYRIRMAIEGK